MTPSRIQSVAAALRLHPSPEDAASVIRNTGFAAMATGLNATIYLVATVDRATLAFLACWSAATLLLCLWLTRKSRSAAARKVTHVSPRGARMLVQSSVALALPWGVLPVYVIGLGGGGDPMLLLLVSAGMLAGGAFFLHRTFVAALSFMATILVPLTASFHAGGIPGAWPITAYSVVYGVFLGFVAYKTGETSRQKDASVGALSEVVERLKTARDENHTLANIDDTTGLPNRKAFIGRLGKAVDDFAASPGGLAVLMMDLDLFKNVNDLFGHRVGDELLREVADRLTRNLPETAVVGRLGGDEFAVLLSDTADPGEIGRISDRLIAALAAPARLNGRHVHTGASIGASIFPEDASDPTGLLQMADLALNRAKEIGRGNWVAFDDTLRQKVIAQDAIEAALREALREDRVFVQYQPKVSMAEGRVVGAEALVRMRDADGSVVPPDDFLPIAAARGVLPQLSRHIADKVARDILLRRGASAAWRKIALNIHPADIKVPEYLMDTIDILEGRGITGADLVLEFTEGCFIGRGTDQAALVLDRLAERGYELSLDDFGTGHASLSHLKSIPVAEIKIDQSFVRGIEARQDDRAIVEAIVAIAKGMGIRSVAEGVETETQRAILSDLGVDLGQGYLWSRPLDADRFTEFMQQGLREAG